MYFNCKLILIIVFSFLVISCSTKNDKEDIKIGFSQCINDDEWRKYMDHAMEVEASLHENINLTIYHANRNAEIQIAQIEMMIKDQVDVIIVSPIESEALTQVVEKAYLKGIPVILIDRKVNTNNYTAYLGADNIEVGRIAGQFLISLSKGEANVVEIKGELNTSPGLERSLGFRQIVDQHPKVNLIKSLVVENYGLPVSQFQRLLDSFPSINYVYAFNDIIASQAWEIAKKKGMEKKIKFIGVDGLVGPNGGIQLVKNGMLSGTILYPTGGNEAIKLALKILDGESVPKKILLNTILIDSNNADIMQNQFDKINEQQRDIENQLDTLYRQEELYTAQNNLLKITMALLAVVFSLAIYSIYSILTIRKKNRQLELINKKITIQRNQIEKIANEVKESNEAKLNFFTGISHEFKTPITLIMSAIESLKDSNTQKGDKTKYEVELINNNSLRLLRLINNLLDFRRVEDKKFNLRASKTNMLTFSKNIYKDFENEAIKRGIKFILETNNEELELFIDRNLMDKVYFNLLSNAFKFTPDNGKIEIIIIDNMDGNNASIHLKDNGIGILEKELGDVFDAFFKGSNNRKNSSGIGLHLSKQFVELHLGNIEVKSFHGTEFIITLFKGNTHFNEDQLIVEPELVYNDIMDFSSEISIDEDYLINELTTNSEKYSILIIEDNRDLSFFLKNKLSVEYNIILSDGTDSIEKAFDHIPDIILCDVNLPEKSGFEICEILKKDLRTSHIPTIMLTALGNKESYLKGLQSGVDLYLTKPFSYAILIQSIKSLLYNREKLRFYYINNIFRIEQTDAFGNPEQEFISKLNKLINENLDNSGLSVESLAEDLHISRVQLYRKVKAMLGINVSDYISDFRLEKAKSMLENTSLNISEIAYSHGFSSPNYFSTSFKNKFGKSPKAYRNE